MKKVLFLVCLAVVFVAGISMVSARWWDTETSRDNKVQAGSLDLQVNGEEDPDVPAVINAGPDDHLPGKGDDGKATVKNCGTCDGIVGFQFCNVRDVENDLIEPEATAGDVTPDCGELSPYVTMKVKYGQVEKTGKLTELCGQDIDLGALKAGDDRIVTIYWTIDESAPVVTMTDSVLFDIVFTLHQE